MHTAPITNGHLAYDDRGAGPPVVLLHGGVLDHRMWSRQSDVFARDHRVIAPDARGHGASSTPRRPFRHCDDVAELLAHLGLPRVALVGLSLGAGTAVDVAVEYPELVSSVVVSGTGTSDPDWRDPWILDMQARWARNQAEQDATGWLETFLLIGNGPDRSLADLDPQVLAELREQSAATIATHVADGAPVLPTTPSDVRRRAHDIRVPVLAVIGGDDADDHRRLARDLAEGVARGRTVTVDGAAHYPNMERPDEFNRVVSGFLAE